MSEATVRANIKTILESVTSIGQVHDYERWAAEWTDFLSFFKTRASGTDTIRGWTISLEGWPATEAAAIRGATVTRPYVYRIRGYLGLNDSSATEKTAIALAEAVCDALDGDTTIHGSNPSAEMAKLEVFEPRFFGNVLCHYIEIQQTVNETLTIS